MRLRRRLTRAVAAFVLLPGVIAFALPLFVLRPDAAAFRAGALVPLGAGITLLVWCIHDFFTAGKGSLAPWDPPTSLVTSGPYRRSRNPMYLAVLLILSGWTIGFWSLPLLGYAVAVGVAFHLRVVHGEEPWLARRYGEDWERYRKAVPRWFA